MQESASKKTSSVVISVIVVPLRGHSDLQRCLRALSQQSGVQAPEIIVPYDQAISHVSKLAAEFPTIQFLPARGRRTYAELRALGVQQATGAIIALTEDHCIPQADWCEQILQAHSGPYAAVGGAVEKSGSDTMVNWALYLADYIRYMNPRPASVVDHLSDCNVTYKRAALDPIQAVWQVEFHEPSVHAALQQQGELLWFAPTVVVNQQRTMRFGAALRDRYIFGRLFGSERALLMTKGRRAFYAMMAFLLPFLLVGRVTQHVFGKRRCIEAFMFALPMLIILSVAWATGELIGYVTARPETSLTPQLQTALEHSVEQKVAT
ncbi:hypothetical protein BH10CHL1_BH10CHL1_27090 [soil metagenome]